ncbi:MAG TPA: hypothetical protein VE172_09430 [Stackebrandtia sp.]|jgi:hypothetical protein|uniref:hypothetical protein n=1 Tax=Stackebrandtia sp. TaxID=2023065 RepID=UPI002D32CB52|nr:hypothetical protein [Stackebrandtia sp.]HZE39016.1 hypothetical protein [Stackebrandtia sp.]
MRHPGKIAALAIVAAAILTPSAAYAATVQSNLVDGSVTTSGTTCNWTNAATSADPPATATVDGSTVKLTCDDGTPVTLNNSPVISFDDAAGTGTADAINITATKLGQTCTYEATNVTLNRDGDTRNYAGGPFTANKTDGSILCPSTATLDTASVAFH